MKELIKSAKDFKIIPNNFKSSGAFDVINVDDEKIEAKLILIDDKELSDYTAGSSVEVFGGKKEEVEAVCANFLLDTIFDLFGRNITIIKNDKETFRVIVDTSTRGFKMWAMRNIDCVEVIRPESLRKEMKEIIKIANRKYDWIYYRINIL